MALRLRPRKEQIHDLKQIASLGSAKLSELADRLQADQSALLKPAQLAKLIREVVGEGAADSLVRQVFSLRGLVRRFGTTIEEIVDGLRPWLKDALPENDQTDAVVDSLAAAFRNVLDCKLIRMSATANELSYDYANLIRHIRILSDIRPLYDDHADVIDGAVISHTMRLQYDSADGEHELSLALDEEDIAKLMRQCDRALKKSVAAKKLMEEKAGIPTILSGQDAGAAE